MPPSVKSDLLQFISQESAKDVAAMFTPENMVAMFRGLGPEDIGEILIAKNIKIFGGADAYVADFAKQTVAGIAKMPEGVAKQRAVDGQRTFAKKLLARGDLSQSSKDTLNNLMTTALAIPAALDMDAVDGGRRRRGRSTRRRKSTRKSRRARGY
jgi:hypothetical protein